MSLTSLDSFDKWYIITLENRDTSDIINNLKNVGVTKYEPLYYKPLDKNNTSNNEWTCKNNVCENLFMNTYQTLKKAYDNNLNNVVILEDDARFELPLDKKKISHILDWMNNNEWDLFYLGNGGYVSFSILKTKHIVKPFKPLLTHAIIFSKQGIYKTLHAMEYTILYNKNDIKHVDVFYNSIPNLKQYAIFPSISYQNKRPALFPKYIKNYNGFYYYTGILSIIFPVVLIFLICFLVIYHITKKHIK
jgi:hypothetical protein